MIYELDLVYLNLISKIKGLISTDKLEDILPKCFPEFLHNRVGDLLLKTEKDNLDLSRMPKFEKGKLVVYQSRYDQYEWAIYMGESDTPKKKEILIKNKRTNVYINKEVFSSSLIHYPEYEEVLQNSKRNHRLNVDSLIETYNFE